MRILIAILLLSAVILFHEFGHFLFAKLNHIVVTEFSLGFGPRLLSFKRGETRYSIKLFLLGGSCAMLGEDADDISPGAFNQASALRRISVVAAGPLFNLVLAVVLSSVIIGIAGAEPAIVDTVSMGSPAEEAGLAVGDRIVRYEGNGIANASELYFDLTMDDIPTDSIDLVYERAGKKHRISYAPELTSRYLLGFTYTAGKDDLTEIVRVQKGSPIAKAGALMGDRIVAVDGHETPTFSDLETYLDAHPFGGDPVVFTLERGSQRFDIEMTPREQQVASLGFSVPGKRTKVGFLQTIGEGIKQTSYWIHVTVKSLTGLVTGAFSIREMSGPVGIVNAVGSVYEEARQYGIGELILSLINFAVLISANLGVVNLLPIPALDGGRLVFLIIEAIRKKPVKRELEGVVHFIGFVALMALIVFVCYNDITKLF